MVAELALPALNEDSEDVSEAPPPGKGEKLASLVTEYYHQEALGQGADAAASVLASTLGLMEYQTDAHAAIRLDYITYALNFARDAGYGPVRTASLLSVVLSLLDATAAGSNYPEVEAIFKSEMVQLTSPKPSHDSTLFSPDQVAAVAHFMARTLFRHWRLYAYVFSQPQDLSEHTQGLLVETAVVPSFDAALHELEWTAAQAAASAARTAEAQAAVQAAAAAAVEAESAEARARVEMEADRRAEELARKPATLEEAVEHLVALRVDAERKTLAQEYAAKEEVLMAKLTELESREITRPPPTPTGKR
mmetsp:Transcript_21978/g.37605  ORF Transcript_21978/g.37605 Transcript_21978/m.37605 type:complete len:307 (+) Transcript_21978:95-1015(+)|eukprot:CAMPEP_0119102688 /NCGR_PEP_ID=MMETSP1180-20130426/1347_1 /TAXON_ID=3052 ORGANISM="Chlamydomonas cf sp, Strain CCMP681" /NCGR_SAMPLE_ID=MMETSP1180 /ASSEMBLY_ACC=CAM_ASM_000741 /LENGTH=306 /DNA_ID=CAMNT_0007087015 /DNA_START=91 /DNA_END=1011 /DNA_ORIENTATION=+